MLEKDNKAPEARKSNKGIINNDIEIILLKTIPDSIPGCFGEYESNNKKAFLTRCDYCDVRLECARQSAGSE